MVIKYFGIANTRDENSKLAENKKCPIQGVLPDGLIVSIELDRVGLRIFFVCYVGIISNHKQKVNTQHNTYDP